MQINFIITVSDILHFFKKLDDMKINIIVTVPDMLESNQKEDYKAIQCLNGRNSDSDILQFPEKENWKAFARDNCNKWRNLSVNPGKFNQNWIVNTLFRFIWHQTELCLVPNDLENCNYTHNLVHFNRSKKLVSLCAYNVSPLDMSEVVIITPA